MLIKQMRPMPMTTSVIAIMLRKGGGGEFYCEARLLYETNRRALGTGDMV